MWHHTSPTLSLSLVLQDRLIPVLLLRRHHPQYVNDYIKTEWINDGGGGAGSAGAGAAAGAGAGAGAGGAGGSDPNVATFGSDISAMGQFRMLVVAGVEGGAGGAGGAGEGNEGAGGAVAQQPSVAMASSSGGDDSSGDAVGLVGLTREDGEEGGGDDASTGAETKGADEGKDTVKGIDDEGRADSKDTEVESPEMGLDDVFDPVLAISNDATAAAAATFTVLRGLRARTAEHAGGAPAAAEAEGGGGTLAKLTAAAKAVAQAVEMCGQRQREAEAAEAALTSVRASAKWEEASLIRDAEEQALQVRNTVYSS